MQSTVVPNIIFPLVDRNLILTCVGEMLLTMGIAPDITPEQLCAQPKAITEKHITNKLHYWRKCNKQFDQALMDRFPLSKQAIEAPKRTKLKQVFNI